MAGSPPYPPPPGVLPFLHRWMPLGAPQIMLSQTSSQAMQAAHIKHPSPCLPPAPLSSVQPPSTVMDFHLHLPPWEQGSHPAPVGSRWERQSSTGIPGPASSPDPSVRLCSVPT